MQIYSAVLSDMEELTGKIIHSSLNNRQLSINIRLFFYLRYIKKKTQQTQTQNKSSVLENQPTN